MKARKRSLWNCLFCTWTRRTLQRRTWKALKVWPWMAGLEGHRPPRPQEQAKKVVNTTGANQKKKRDFPSSRATLSRRAFSPHASSRTTLKWTAPEFLICGGSSCRRLAVMSSVRLIVFVQIALSFAPTLLLYVTSSRVCPPTAKGRPRMDADKRKNRADQRAQRRRCNVPRLRRQAQPNTAWHQRGLERESSPLLWY